MSARTYLLSATLLTLLCLSALATFNYVVDPYRFFDSATRPGINEYRQRFFFGQWISKPYALRRAEPEAVILGVSRAGSSMSTEHVGWHTPRVYNYAMAGSSAYQLWRHYQHAKASGNLKQVVLMLDMYMFNVHSGQHPNIGHLQAYDERLAVTPQGGKNWYFPVRAAIDTLSALISFEMAYESWHTVLAQKKIARGEIHISNLTKTGYWINEPHPQHSQRRIFHIIEQQYMTNTWFPRPDFRFSLGTEENNKLIYLEYIIADAYAADIDLRIGFMPFHARLAESMRAVGIWDDFELWKKQVLAVVEQEAHLAASKPFPVWDFTGYNSITIEPVPSSNDKATRMRWHLDPSHVSQHTGELILNAILGSHGSGVTDFGFLVDSETIDSYLDRSRLMREQYVRNHPEDLKEILRRAEKTRHKRNEE